MKKHREVTAGESIQLLQKALVDPKRSAETSRQYLDVLKRLHRRLGSQVPVHEVQHWAKVDALLPILREYMHTSKKFFVAVLLVALRPWPAARAKWLGAFEELTERVARRQNGQRTKREVRNWVTSAELQHKINELDTQVRQMQSAGDPQRRRVLYGHLGLRMLTDQGTLRTQNLANVRLTTREDEDQEGNVLLSTDRGKSYTLILRRFKTASSLGPQRIELPSKLCKVVRRSLRLCPRRYLISQLRYPTHGMSPNQLSQFFAKIWPDKRVTPSLLRKVVVSEFYKTKPSIEARVALSQAMLHSVAVQKSYYAKRT